MEHGDGDRPLVSIVVPVFNGGAYLREALDSIVAQTYDPIEVLVLDDASDDDSASIAESYGAPVTVVRQATRRGIYDNANDGIERARGEYIAVYHADDVYDADIVAREAATLGAHPDVGAVFALDVFINEDGAEWGRLRLPSDVAADEPLDHPIVLNGLLRHKNAFLRCPGAMVRASAYREVGLYRQDRYRNTADLEMWLRLAKAGPIMILGEHLYRYRSGHGSSSGRYQHLRTTTENFFTIIDEHLANGNQVIATDDALAAYEGHRAEDRLMTACSLYILDRCTEAQATLADVSPRHLARTRHVQRGRLLVLLAALQLLTRIPRSERIARIFYARWHAHRDAVPIRSG